MPPETLETAPPTPEPVASTPTVPEWTFPENIRRGDRLVFARTLLQMNGASERQCTMMLVTEVIGNSVSGLAMTTGGYRPVFNARHWQDPAIKTRPHLLDDIHTGVFRLADSEQDVRQLAQTVAAQDELIAELAARCEHFAREMRELRAMPSPAESAAARLEQFQDPKQTPAKRGRPKGTKNKSTTQK